MRNGYALSSVFFRLRPLLFCGFFVPCAAYRIRMEPYFWGNHERLSETACTGRRFDGFGVPSAARRVRPYRICLRRRVCAFVPARPCRQRSASFRTGRCGVEGGQLCRSRAPVQCGGPRCGPSHGSARAGVGACGSGGPFQRQHAGRPECPEILEGSGPRSGKQLRVARCAEQAFRCGRRRAAVVQFRVCGLGLASERSVRAVRQ